MSKIVLHLIESNDYLNRVMDLLKEQKDRKIVYINTSKTHCFLMEEMRKRGIDPGKFFFIDCITNQSQGKLCSTNTVLIGGPESLTDINIAIDEGIKKVQDNPLIVVDSISILLIYNNEERISKFANYFVNKLRTLNIDALILGLKSDENKDVTKHVEALVDATIRE